MFDLLAITWTVSPDILSIGSFHLRWYSVLFVAGFFPLGYYIMRSFYKREGIPLESLDVLLFALMICAIVGARLGHCIAYDFKYYFTHPWKILMTWEGGLASHGGATHDMGGRLSLARRSSGSSDCDVVVRPQVR